MTNYEQYKKLMKNLREICGKYGRCTDCPLNNLNCTLSNMSEEAFNIIMNYKPKPKSYQMFEDLGFKFSVGLTYFSDCIEHTFTKRSTDSSEVIGITCDKIYIDRSNLGKYEEALEQLNDDIQDGLYELKEVNIWGN